MDKTTIINAYVRRIKRGVITIEDVHPTVRKEVADVLNKGKGGKSNETVKQNL